MIAPPADADRRFEAPAVYDFDESLRFVPMGAYDLACRRGPGVLWKAGRTPIGPVTLEPRQATDALVARAWGPGASWAVERAPALFGLEDDPASFRPPPGRLGILARRGRGLHLPRTPFVFDALTGVILQQRAAWRDATHAHRWLTDAFGEPAPGPAGLTLPLSPRQWAALSGEDLRRAGVDAVIVGDLHLPRLVAWALAGEHEADDARMVELLEPHRGHRFRLVRLLYAAGLGAQVTSRSRASRR